MRPYYYEQLRRHLEPETMSIQSKAKSITANSHSSVFYGATGVKNKHDLLQNQQTHGSFSSFDNTVLM